MDVLQFLDPKTLIMAGGLLGLFLIVLAETGLFFGFFFPGDSLLFTAGFLASRGWFDLTTLILVLVSASLCGNIIGYYFGKHVGRRLFFREDSFFFHKDHVTKTSRYFEKHGTKTIFFARFFPIIRTFAPILAGVGGMDTKKFVGWTILGGVLWAGGLPLIGFSLGNAIPDIDRYLIPIIGGIVLVSVIPGLVHLLNQKRG